MLLPGLYALNVKSCCGLQDEENRSTYVFKEEMCIEENQTIFFSYDQRLDVVEVCNF